MTAVRKDFGNALANNKVNGWRGFDWPFIYHGLNVKTHSPKTFSLELHTTTFLIQTLFITNFVYKNSIKLLARKFDRVYVLLPAATLYSYVASERSIPVFQFVKTTIGKCLQESAKCTFGYKTLLLKAQF